jgi:hypothetical protein
MHATYSAVTFAREFPDSSTFKKISAPLNYGKYYRYELSVLHVF